MSAFTIRAFTDNDYQHVPHHQMVRFPDLPVSEQFFRNADRNRHPDMPTTRWVAEVNGQVVANAYVHKYGWTPDAEAYDGNIMLLPAYDDSGIVEALHDNLVAHVHAANGTALYMRVRDTHVPMIQFVEASGYTVAQVERNAELQLDTVDLSPHADAIPRLAASGITIHAEPTLRHRDGHLQRLFEAENEIAADVPDPESLNMMDFASWQKQLYHLPDMNHDAWFVAVDGDDYVGISNGFRDSADPTVHQTGLTGVKRGYRRRGIAFALKVRVIEWALANGYRVIKTTNDATNDGMLSINTKLGYRQLPSWRSYRKLL